MKLNYITFMVRDIEKTITFYQEIAGLRIVRQMDLEQGKIVFMSNAENETMLEFVNFASAPKVEVSAMTMSFQVDCDLEELRSKIIRMGYKPSEIIHEPPKPEHFKVLDNDGIEVEFSL